MQSTQSQPFCLQGRLSFADPVTAVEELRARAVSLGLSVRNVDAGSYQVETRLGLVDLAIARDAVEISVTSGDDVSLYMLKDLLEGQLEAGSASVSKGLEWTGSLKTHGIPPNYCEAQVTCNQRLGPTFQRITITADALERFSRTAMHFRLVLPPEPSQTLLSPWIDEQGKLAWPPGYGSLRKPFYTVRSFDGENNSIVFDVFLHEGGRTSGWARSVEKGAKLGLLGPSGGWIPQARRMVLAGDETAIPAICRIIDSMPHTTRASVILSVEKESCRPPISNHPGIQVDWVIRGPDNHEALLDAVQNLDLPKDDSIFIWFAAKKSIVKKARSHFRDKLGYHSRNSYLAGFWD